MHLIVRHRGEIARACRSARARAKTARDRVIFVAGRELRAGFHASEPGFL
jgi:hypothetical protein